VCAAQVDLLPEITQAPRVLGKPTAPIASFVGDLERYIKTKMPSAFPLNLKDRLRMAPDAAAGSIATGASRVSLAPVWCLRDRERPSVSVSVCVPERERVRA
jgi:hypothetical protein